MWSENHDPVLHADEITYATWIFYVFDTFLVASALDTILPQQWLGSFLILSFWYLSNILHVLTLHG